MDIKGNRWIFNPIMKPRISIEVTPLAIMMGLGFLAFRMMKKNCYKTHMGNKIMCHVIKCEHCLEHCGHICDHCEHMVEHHHECCCPHECDTEVAQSPK